jgi:hypothetical protein
VEQATKIPCRNRASPSRSSGADGDGPREAVRWDADTSTHEGLWSRQPRPLKSEPAPAEQPRADLGRCPSKRGGLRNLEPRPYGANPAKNGQEPKIRPISKQIEIAAAALRIAPEEHTIRRLRASRTVLGNIVNAKTLPGLSPDRIVSHLLSTATSPSPWQLSPPLRTSKSTAPTQPRILPCSMQSLREGPLAPAARLSQFLFSSDDTAKVLVYLGGTPAAPRVMHVHCVFKYAPSMAGPSQ